MLLSNTDPIPVLRILTTPLQTKLQSSIHSKVSYRHSIRPPYIVYNRPSTSPPYTLQSTRHSTCFPYTLQSTTDPVPVLRLLYNPVKTQYQSSVYSEVNYRQNLILRILYSTLQSQFQSFIYSTVL